MALNSNGRFLLPTIITAVILLGFDPAVAWGQSADTWQEKLRGTWCDAERGCAHWWTLYQVSVDVDDNIEIRYRDQPSFVFFYGKLQEPVGRWTIKATITTDGKHKGKEFEAAASSVEYLKEIVQGKFKGSLKAKIQAAAIEGITVHDTGAIATISDAKVDEPKIDTVTVDKVAIEKAEIKEPQTDGPVLKGAKQIKGDRLEAESLKAKKIVGKGGKQVEISIPIQISEATIEGIAKPKRDKGKKEDEAEDDEGGQKKKRILVEGTVKGKIAGLAGPGELEGDFEGTFTALVQAVVKGSYGVPPRACSEAGRPLSEEEREDLKIRRKLQERRRTEERQKAEERRKAEEGLRGEEHRRAQKRQKADERRKEKEDQTVVGRRPGRYLSKKETEDTEKFTPFTKPFIDAASKDIPVEAMKTTAPRPAERHTRGRFMRKVTGVVNALEPATITLDLPPLPVLDHKCSVIDELPKRTLKLVKQHDALTAH